jgi:hypothetical protein
VNNICSGKIHRAFPCHEATYKDLAIIRNKNTFSNRAILSLNHSQPQRIVVKTIFSNINISRCGRRKADNLSTGFAGYEYSTTVNCHARRRIKIHVRDFSQPGRIALIIILCQKAIWPKIIVIQLQLIG